MKLNSLPLAARLGSYALLATLAGLPLCASAEHGAFRAGVGPFIGGGIGYDRLNGEDFTPGGNNDVDDKRVTYKALGGFRLNPIVSLEGQYVDFGTAEGGGNRVKAHGFTADVVLNVPVSPYVQPYGKAGVLFWDADGEFNNVNRTNTGNDFTFGVGVRFCLNDRLDFRTEYERFEFSLGNADNKVDNVSAMLQFNF